MIYLFCVTLSQVLQVCCKAIDSNIYIYIYIYISLMATRFIKLEPAELLLKRLLKEEVHVGEWNIILTKYLSRGKIEDALYLFDKMPNRDVTSYTTMINSLCNQGILNEARKVFDRMRVRDTTAWKAMITGYANNGKLEEARMLLNGMPGQDTVLRKVLIIEYMNRGKVSEAVEIFKGGGEFYVDTCNAMISGFCKNGLVSEAQKLFDRMKRRDIYSWAGLISGYVEKNKDLKRARQLFDEMPEKDEACWKVMLEGYISNLDMSGARDLFDRMDERDVGIWNRMISGYARDGNIKAAEALFNQMPSRSQASWTSMMSAYARHGKIEEARRLFDMSPCHENVVTWNAMITGYGQNWCKPEALMTFGRMMRYGVRPNLCTYMTVLNICGFQSDLEQGMQIHEDILRNGLLSCWSKLNVDLISMYSRCGNIENAKKCFNKTSKPDVMAWNGVIQGYVQLGLGNEAFKFFERMLQSGTRPDSFTFVGGLGACSSAGKVEEGMLYFESMRRVYGIRPNAEHCAYVVDLLGRDGQLKKALDVINSMPFIPDTRVWAAFLRACHLHGNLVFGKRAAESLIMLKPYEITPYVMLSHIYAEKGLWGKVHELREMMKGKEYEKDTGYSWIVLRNDVHYFMMGDMSHPQIEAIYAKLKELSALIEKEEHVTEAELALDKTSKTKERYFS